MDGDVFVCNNRARSMAFLQQFVSVGRFYCFQASSNQIIKINESFSLQIMLKSSDSKGKLLFFSPKHKKLVKTLQSLFSILQLQVLETSFSKLKEKQSKMHVIFQNSHSSGCQSSNIPQLNALKYELILYSTFPQKTIPNFFQKKQSMKQQSLITKISFFRLNLVRRTDFTVEKFQDHYLFFFIFSPKVKNSTPRHKFKVKY